MHFISLFIHRHIYANIYRKYSLCAPSHKKNTILAFQTNQCWHEKTSMLLFISRMELVLVCKLNLIIQFLERYFLQYFFLNDRIAFFIGQRKQFVQSLNTISTFIKKIPAKQLGNVWSSYREGLDSTSPVLTSVASHRLPFTPSSKYQLPNKPQ